MLGPILTAAGYAVTSAAGAADALARIRSGERFDIIVTDLDMPDTTWLRTRANPAERSDNGGYAVIGLPPMILPDLAHCARQVGIRDCVAKFDRAADRGAAIERPCGRAGGMNEAIMLQDRRSGFCRVRHRGGRRPAIRPADRAGPGRVRAVHGLTRVPLAPLDIEWRAQPARPHRHRPSICAAASD